MCPTWHLFHPTDVAPQKGKMHFGLRKIFQNREVLMAKLIKIADWLSVNPDHVASVRHERFPLVEGVTVELSSGTRHSIGNMTVQQVLAKLNGEGDENSR